MWSGDRINSGLSAEQIAAMLTEESPMPGAETQWYPADIHGKRYRDVSAEIAAAASEAHTCLAVEAYRGAVLVARSVIEATAKDKGINTGNLIQKIDAMYQARLIRDDVRDGAHEVRHLGNDMAHGDYTDLVFQTDAELVVSLMDEVLQEVYQAPARVARRRAARLAKGS
jgi:hypothetical protein